MDRKEVVLVTGGARRLGKEITLHLVDAGYRVVVLANSSLREAQELAERRSGIAWIEGDLRDVRTLESQFAKAVGQFGRIDHLVNNASIFPAVDIENTDIDLFQDAMAIHSTSPFFLSRALYLHVKERGCKGSVVNIIDSKIDAPTASRPAYYCAKGALAYQTKALAVALGPTLRVNAVSPGLVLSNTDDAYFASMQEKLPLRMTGTCTDVSKAVEYFLGAPFVTGMELCIDGGQRLL